MKKTLLTIALSSLLLSAVGANAGELKIGATPVPHGEILEFVKPMVKDQGVDLTVVEFNDYVQPNLATDDGELDGNYFQHRPYLETFTRDHGVDLVEVCGVHIEPMGIYSRSIAKLDELPDGAVVAIPNDPTNGGRALLLLAAQGLIKLADMNNITCTVMDITDNPKNLDIRELEAAQLPRSLDDVAAAVINTNFAMAAGLVPGRDAIAIEGAESPYVNVLVANPKSVNTDEMKALVKALQSEETRKFIEEKYEGAILAAF